MPQFPDFVRNPRNRIARAAQYTEGVEGYLFDGCDGSQVALWSASAHRLSAEHTHDFDEYVFVLEGRCVAVLEGQRRELRAGEELLLPRGTRQAMEVDAGTRRLHVFGGQRAHREPA